MRSGAAVGSVLAAGLLELPLAAFGQVSLAPAALPLSSAAPTSPATAPAPASAGTNATGAPTEIRVTASRVVPPAQIDPIELFDADFITKTDAFTADEVLTNLAASLSGSQQVVLIDGHETLVDISTIPADRIERIEVSTTGVMPDGRPRIVGNVINIILKKKYNGAAFGARRRNSFAGGGGQTQLNVSGGVTHGDLGIFVNAIHREQDALLASQRDFSSSQNYTSLGGADYRLPYGSAPVVQAVDGALNGIVDANGLPVSIALAPATSPGHPVTPADFLPAPPGTVDAAGLRHFNTAGFLYLTAPSKSDVINSDLNYALTQRVNLHAGYTFTRSDSQQSGPPPVTPISGASIVPAAYSPFGQDIEVGLVHAGFGGVQQQTSSDRRSGYFSADGQLASTWKWSGRFDLNHRSSAGKALDLDADKFAAALAAASPLQRFNPFAQTGSGSADAALYPGLVNLRRSSGSADDSRLRAEVQGQVSQGWVAPVLLNVGIDRSTDNSRQSLDPGVSVGPAMQSHSRLDSVRLNGNLDVPLFKVRELGSPAVLTVATYATRDRQQLSQAQSAVPPQASAFDVRTMALNGLLDVPWTAPADARPWAYQVQTQLGMGVVRSAGESGLTADVGAIWAPLKPLVIRAHLTRQQSPTPAVLYPLTVNYNQTLIDRQRADSIANNVEVVSGQPQASRPPLVTQKLVSMQWNPPALEKLRLTLTYLDVTQRDQLRNFSAQDILDNEAALSGRVTRIAPTDEDAANGLPGEITQVDITPFSGGQREDRSLGFRAQFSYTGPKIGTLTIRGSAQHILSSNNELIAGIPIVSTDDQEVPPAWKAFTQADWQRGKWGAGSTFTYVGGGRYAGLPYASFGTVDARVVYQIEHPLNGWLGKTLRIGAGIQNLFDRAPPFANTITGYRGGSPLGRTYELTVRAAVGG